jgi:hypothetical protein
MVGNTGRTSMSRFIFMMEIAAPGLADARK